MKRFYTKLAGLAIVLLAVSGGIVLAVNHQQTKNQPAVTVQQEKAMKATEADAMKQAADAKAATQVPAEGDAMQRETVAPTPTDSMQRTDTMTADK